MRVVLGLLTLAVGTWVMGSGCGAQPSPWARDMGACVPCPDGGTAAVKAACGVDYCIYRFDVAALCCGKGF